MLATSIFIVLFHFKGYCRQIFKLFYLFFKKRDTLVSVFLYVKTLYFLYNYSAYVHV